MYAVCAVLAGSVYVAFGGPVGHLAANSFPSIFVPVLLADLTHCVVNGLLLTGVIALSERVPPRQVLVGTLSKSVASYLGYGVFGLLMAVLWVGVGIGPLAALLVLLPLLVARWAFSQFAAEQQAYEATIASLVQAVETKDRYTRGHSERVARASVLIARVDRDARGPRQRAALRRDPARRREARRADQAAAEDRAGSPRTSSRPSSCTRCAAWRCSATSSSSTRRSRGSCTTTSGSTAAATRWACGARDPRVRPRHRRRRRVRLDDLDPLVPRRPHRRRGRRRAAALQGHASSTRAWSTRSSRRWAASPGSAPRPGRRRTSCCPPRTEVEAVDHDDPSLLGPASSGRADRDLR